MSAQSTDDPAQKLRSAALGALVLAGQELSVLPDTAMRAIALARDPNSETKELSAVVKADAALGGRVLSLANSTAYASQLRSPIVSLDKAVVRIGRTALLGLIIQVSLRASVLRIRGLEAEIRSLARHELFSALATREIARSLGLDAELGFLLGLLHDVGRVIGLEAYTRASKAEKSALALEAIGMVPLLDQVHEEIGAFAAKRWGLPPHVETAIRHHHLVPARLASMQWPSVARIGDLLAHQVDPDPRHPDIDVRELPESYQLGLTPKALEGILARVPEAAAELSAALGAQA